MTLTNYRLRFLADNTTYQQVTVTDLSGATIENDGGYHSD